MTHDWENTVLHESGHLAAAVVLRLRPTRAEVFPDLSGRVSVSESLFDDPSVEKSRRICLMVMAGPASDLSSELPGWPLRRNAQSRAGKDDETLLAIFTSALRFDKSDYYDLQLEALDLTLEPRFKRAFVAAETLFRRSRVIDKRGIAIVEWAAWDLEGYDAGCKRDPELCAA